MASRNRRWLRLRLWVRVLVKAWAQDVPLAATVELLFDYYALLFIIIAHRRNVHILKLLIQNRLVKREPIDMTSALQAIERTTYPALRRITNSLAGRMNDCRSLRIFQRLKPSFTPKRCTSTFLSYSAGRQSNLQAIFEIKILL